MDQLQGRIEQFAPESGLKAFLRFNVTLISRYELVIDLMTVSARVSFLFSEMDRVVSSIPTTYVGDAQIEWKSRIVAPGEGNAITLFLPVDFNLLEKIEEIRQGHDVDVSVRITFNGIERQSAGTLGHRTVSGEIRDARTNAQGVTKTIAKSAWSEYLKIWNYSASQRDAAQELRKTIAEAQRAKREAEEAAAAAKQAAQLTAVTSLSEAYSDEAMVLAKRSQRWALISLLVAAVGGYAMVCYVRESVTNTFTLPQAVVLPAKTGHLS